MIDWAYCSISLLCFEIPLLYYYVNLGSLIICCLSPGDIYLSFSISLYSISFLTISKLFRGELSENFVILSAILLLITLPFSSAVF